VDETGEIMSSTALDHDWARRRHEERVAAGLRIYEAGAGRVRARRSLRRDPCPLAVLAERLAARRRRTATVAH
jgi:hypothetical protein